MQMGTKRSAIWIYLRPLVGAVVVDTLVVITEDGDGGGSVLGPGADGDEGQN
jgi:hypothetical protein